MALDTKEPTSIADAMARLDERVREREALAREQRVSPTPPEQQVQQVQLSATQVLEGLLAPPNTYSTQDVFAGVKRLEILASQVFHMSIPDTCAALQFVLTTLNRTSRYKATPVEPAVYVPVSPLTQ